MRYLAFADTASCIHAIRRGRCKTANPKVTKEGDLEHYVYSCPGVPVEHYKIVGGGHNTRAVGSDVKFAFIRACEAVWNGNQAASTTVR